MSTWEDNFQIFLNELLQKKSTVLLTDEKVERIKSLIIDTRDGQKTDTPRFRQYVKDKGFHLVTCAVLGLENELCVPTKEECERPGLLAHWRRVVTVENMFKTLKLVHEGTRSHTGYHKLFKDVEDTFYGVPRSLCKEFIKGCVKCACKKPQNNIAPLKPISSKHFMHRGQLDLVDKRADPDGPFCWIGHYNDHFSKFNFFWPPERKSAIEVAHNLKVHVFSVIGLPFILQHDNGREFCNDIIRETIKIWPGGNVKIITGRPRHPRTQGLVEQVHNSLHRLLAAKRSETPGSGWLEHLYEVQYSLNTQHHSSIKVTPYEAVFGQKANDGVFVVTNATDEFINEEAIEMFISEDIPTDIDSQTDNESQTDIDSQTDIEKNYKHSVQNTMRKYNKKMSKSNAHIVKGYFVTVRIPVIERASGDLPRLLCKVDDVSGKDQSLFKLSCEYGILQSYYDIGDLELLNNTVDTSEWSKTSVSLHAAAKKASFSLASKRCNCKGSCTTRTCKCRKAMVPCGSKCHPKTTCKNTISDDN